MPAGFKIAEAYVAVIPKDQDFEANLKAIVEAAASNVEADIGLGLRHDAPEELKADLDAALFLVTEKLNADVGMGLRNDAVGDLDKDVKAGIALVEEDNKIKVKVDPQASSSAGQQAGGGFGKAFAIGAGAILGSPVLAEAALAGIPLMLTAVSGYFLSHSPDVQRAFAAFKSDISTEMTSAVQPLVPAAEGALSQLDALFRTETPRLGGYFVQLGPDLGILTGGITSLVTNVLPGFDAVMNQSQGASTAFAKGLGLAGEGVAHLLEGLAGGAQGGATGFVAVMTLLDHLLGIIGTDFGRLANSAGPLLATLEPILSAVANDLVGITTSGITTGLDLLNSLLSALPVDVVRGGADAVAMLFAAFKIGTLTGIVAEGTSFLGFLTSAKIGEVALTAETEATSVAMRGMGLAVDAALGPLGLIAGAMALFGLQSTFATGNLTGFIGKVQAAVDAQNQQKQATLDAAAAQVTAVAEVNNVLAIQQQLLVKQTTTSTQATLAAMSFGTTQGGLNNQLSTAISDYNLAKGAASAYGTALSALAGNYGSMQAAEAQVDSNLLSLIDHQKQSTNSFVVGTAAGDQNIQMMQGYSQSILTAAQSIVQQDADTGHAANTNQDLTNYINKQRDAFIQQESKILGSRDAAKKLFDQYIDIKNIGTITTKVNADTSSALDAVGRAIKYIDSQVAYIQVGASGNTVGGHQLLARGGPVDEGDTAIVGEEGPELVMFGKAGRVIPNDKITVASGSSTATSSSGGMTIQNLNITIPMTGFADFTDPNSMTVTARRMAVNISNALVQVGRSGAGAVNR